MFLCRHCPTEIRTTVHALSGRTIDNTFIEWSLINTQVQEEGKIWLHWYFWQQNFLQTSSVTYGQSRLKTQNIPKVRKKYRVLKR